jgi:hypothetical protein
MMGAKFRGVRVMPAQVVGLPASQVSIPEGKTRQTTKIRELGPALAADGFVTLDEQARALGLSRSTTWTVLKGNHKASGLSPATINRMLSSPALPPRARVILLTYVEEKLAGLYGHNKIQLRRFAASSIVPSTIIGPTARGGSTSMLIRPRERTQIPTKPDLDFPGMLRPRKNQAPR